MNRPISPLICLFSFLSILGNPAASVAQHGHGATSDHIESVTVTAERIKEYSGLHPGQVVVMERVEIDQRNILSVEEALNTMAGVDVQPSATTGSRISIRGSSKGGRGILVLLNGRPLNSSQYGGVELSSIPIDLVESVTVFKPQYLSGWVQVPVKAQFALSPEQTKLKTKRHTA